MEALFASWASVQDSLAEVCKTQNPCSTTSHYTHGKIPYRIQLQNTSTTLDIDEAGLSKMIKDLVSRRFSGFVATEAATYTGPHRDTLLVDISLSKANMRMTPQIKTSYAHGSGVHEGIICRTGQTKEVTQRNGDPIPVAESDTLWSSMGITSFTMGGTIYEDVLDIMECYFERKNWPTYRDFSDRNRWASNPWYLKNNVSPPPQHKNYCTTLSSTPTIVGPGIVSRDDRYEFGSALSPNCQELFIGIQHENWVSIEMYERDGESWAFSHHVIGSETASTNDPYMSSDGKRLYFILKRGAQHDIAFIERKGHKQWSAPVVLPSPVNTDSSEFYISFRNNNLVFASNRDATRRGDYNIYEAQHEADGFTEVHPFPEGINTRGYEADPFIHPSGNYLLFASNRKGGRGQGDIYVSFNQGDGVWSDPQPILEINTEGHELCPFVTTDGSTLYYTSNQDIYRINAWILYAYNPKNQVTD